MKHIKITFLTLILLIATIPSAFAQSSLQNTGSGVQNSSSLQQTNSSLQNPTSNTNLPNQINSPSLGVQSSPSQENPSVVVTGNNTKIQEVSGSQRSSSISYLFILIILAVFFGIFFWVLKKKLIMPSLNQVLISSKPTNLNEPEKTVEVPKVKQKKKSKKAHR